MNTLGFVIGRFQPFHNGHLQMVLNAYSVTPNLIIFIGSAQESRTDKNPFTFFERKTMILNELSNHIDTSTVTVLSLPDTNDNESWVKQIQTCLSFTIKDEVIFTYCDKDEGTQFNNQLVLQGIEGIKQNIVEDTCKLNATDIRKILREPINLISDELLTNSLSPSIRKDISLIRLFSDI